MKTIPAFIGLRRKSEAHESAPQFFQKSELMENLEKRSSCLSPRGAATYLQMQLPALTVSNVR